MVMVHWQGPLLLSPQFKLMQQEVPLSPKGLFTPVDTPPTPERSSVACAVKVTVAELVVVSTAIGLNVKLVKTGGCLSGLFFFNDTATTEIYTLSLHDALPILPTTSFADTYGTTQVPASLYA